MMGQLPEFGEAPESGDEEAAIFAEINITPLTDIFLVLLIIFMVTSSVMASRSPPAPLKVELPKGGPGATAAADQILRITVGADGRIALGEHVVETADLGARLSDVHRQSPQARLVVLADQAASHGRVVWVMQVARYAGFEHLAVGTQSPPK